MIVDAAVLDLYAGSGALAIETLSRGAALAVLVERDRSALQAIADNLDQLRLGDRARVARIERRRASRGAAAAGGAVRPRAGRSAVRHLRRRGGRAGGRAGPPGWLAPGALIAVERPAGAETRVPDGFRACWERTFGDTLVFFVDADNSPT